MALPKAWVTSYDVLEGLKETGKAHRYTSVCCYAIEIKRENGATVVEVQRARC